MDLLEHLDAELSELATKRVELEKQLAEVMAEESRLLKGRAAIAGELVPEEKKQGRTHAVEELLQASPKGLHRKEIVEALHAEGRSDDPDDLSASLAYLRRRGRAVNVDGAWSARQG